MSINRTNLNRCKRAENSLRLGQTGEGEGGASKWDLPLLIVTHNVMG